MRTVHGVILGAALAAMTAGCSTTVGQLPVAAQPTLADATARPIYMRPVVPTLAPATGPGSSRAEPLKLGQSGTLNGLTFRVDQVALDARKIAKNLYSLAGQQFVAVKLTVSYHGDGQWGFSGLWSLRAVGKSGVVATMSDFSCQAELPTSDLTNGVTVMGVHSLTGWAACWAVKKTDVATLEMFYEPPFLSPSGGEAPALWFALH